jgi:hypothetical protein
MAKHLYLAGAMSMLIGISSAHAAAGVAQLDQVRGKVLVNHGKGFVAAVASMPLNPGDRIMVAEDSSATIHYAAADCSISLAPASVVTVKKAAPCAPGEVVGAADSVLVTPTLGSGAPIAGGAAYVPIVVSASAVVVGLTSVWIGTHNSGGSVSAP